MDHGIHVYVRACGERTSDLSATLSAAVGIATTVTYVNRPLTFAAHLETMLESAQQMGEGWLLVLDGDILPRVSVMARLRREVDALPSNSACAVYPVLSNALGRFRFAGVHLYQLEVLRRLSDASDLRGGYEVDSRALRPETEFLRMLALRGYPTVFRRAWLGYEDFLQSYEDLFRTGATIRLKYPRYSHAFESWRRRANHDWEALALHLGALHVEVQSNIELPTRAILNEVWMSRHASRFPPQANLSDETWRAEMRVPYLRALSRAWPRQALRRLDPTYGSKTL